MLDKTSQSSMIRLTVQSQSLNHETSDSIVSVTHDKSDCTMLVTLSLMISLIVQCRSLIICQTAVSITPGKLESAVSVIHDN